MSLVTLFWVVFVATIVMALVGFPRKGARLVVFAILLVFCLAGGASAYAGPPPREPTTQDVKRWVKRWCKVKPGMTRRRTIKLMGRPSSSFAGQLSWEGFGYDLTAFFDERQRVRQLDINDIRMTKRQRARLRCADTRSAR